jgi:hypothetical protein
MYFYYTKLLWWPAPHSPILLLFYLNFIWHFIHFYIVGIRLVSVVLYPQLNAQFNAVSFYIKNATPNPNLPIVY